MNIVGNNITNQNQQNQQTQILGNNSSICLNSKANNCNNTTNTTTANATNAIFQPGKTIDISKQK